MEPIKPSLAGHPRSADLDSASLNIALDNFFKRTGVQTGGWRAQIDGAMREAKARKTKRKK
jgi:hypothetical protein